MKISVITVCYNAANTLEQTMLSVLNQTYPDVEYIIIDGGSTDGSVDIIKKYADRLAYWVSEPDKGVYDAMNKGIKAATGEWINFMNAGDKFADNNVLFALFQHHINADVGILFGNTLFVKKQRAVLVKYGDYACHNIMPSCHQSILCRRIYGEKYPFNLNYKLAADYNFFYRLFKLGIKREYIDMVVAVYDAMDGISSRNAWMTKREMLRIENGDFAYWLKIPYSYFRVMTSRFLNLIRDYLKNV